MPEGVSTLTSSLSTRSLPLELLQDGLARPLQMPAHRLLGRLAVAFHQRRHDRLVLGHGLDIPAGRHGAAIAVDLDAIIDVVVEQCRQMLVARSADDAAVNVE